MHLFSSKKSEKRKKKIEKCKKKVKKENKKSKKKTRKKSKSEKREKIEKKKSSNSAYYIAALFRHDSEALKVRFFFLIVQLMLIVGNGAKCIFKIFIGPL